jgi:hypothetical protein
MRAAVIDVDDGQDLQRRFDVGAADLRVMAATALASRPLPNTPPVLVLGEVMVTSPSV